jgi:hypothetical protein
VLLQRLLLRIKILISVLILVVEDSLGFDLPATDVEFVFLLVYAKFSFLYLFSHVLILAFKQLDLCLRGIVFSH